MAQVLDWAIAVSWTSRVLAWRRMLPLVADLAQSDCPQAGPLPSLTVIVPARNEADNIAATLRSLLAAEDVALQIVAVDDRSTDQTGAVMEAMAQAERDAGRDQASGCARDGTSSRMAGEDPRDGSGGATGYG